MFFQSYSPFLKIYGKWLICLINVCSQVSSIVDIMTEKFKTIMSSKNWDVNKMKDNTSEI